MPTWFYHQNPRMAAWIIFFFIESLSLFGLWLARRLVMRPLQYHEGVHEAVSGTVQAIGVFYGITVGLIAVGVWNTNEGAKDLVSKEASSAGALYRDVSGYPSPLREQLRGDVRGYLVYIINDVWPAQKKGQVVMRGAQLLDDFQAKLYNFEPANQGQMALHAETLRAYNNMVDYRRLRIDAVSSGLSGTMWAVIWVGAAFSIGVAYFYKINDGKLHAVLIFLMSGFLALVVFMITINDKPFYGNGSISSDPYKLILEHVIDHVIDSGR